MNSGENLIQNRFDHSGSTRNDFLRRFRCSMILDDVLKHEDNSRGVPPPLLKRSNPKIVFSEIEQKRNTSIFVREKDALQMDEIDVS